MVRIENGTKIGEWKISLKMDKLSWSHFGNRKVWDKQDISIKDA